MDFILQTIYTGLGIFVVFCLIYAITKVITYGILKAREDYSKTLSNKGEKDVK